MTLGGLSLRHLAPGDLDDFFEHQRDPAARWMAAFGAADPDNRESFDAHWSALRRHRDVQVRTIDRAGQALGHVMTYPLFGLRQVGFWVGAPHWGRGVATAALTMFLAELTGRPLQARAAADNLASLQVLRRCGFVDAGGERAYAPGRGEMIDAAVLWLPD